MALVTSLRSIVWSRHCLYGIRTACASRERAHTENECFCWFAWRMAAAAMLIALMCSISLLSQPLPRFA